MSEPAEIPRWTLGWRLQRSLAWGEVSVEEMARELDVSRSTISRWCHDAGAPPRSIYLRAWANKCRVPYEWLTSGDEGLPRMDSNHQPAGWLTDSKTPPSTRELKNMGVPIDELRQRIRYGTLREAR